MGWTEEKIVLLTQLYDSGHTSGQIASLMSDAFCEPFTRNAIMGKLSRLKLKRPEKVEPPPPVTEAPSSPPAVTASAALPRLADCAIVHHKRGQCKWPLGGWPEATPVTFCRYRAFQDYPYCLEHCRISYGWD